MNARTHDTWHPVVRVHTARTIRGRLDVLRASSAPVRPAVLVAEDAAAAAAAHLPRRRRVAHRQLAALRALPCRLVLPKKQETVVPALDKKDRHGKRRRGMATGVMGVS